MKTLFLLPILLLSLISFSSWGADFQKGKDAYDSGDYETALSEWRPLAEEGRPSAQYNLGLMYLNVYQDLANGTKMWIKSAAQGQEKAKRGLHKLKPQLKRKT